jgi:ACS family D-galactonate transporter-like MFS transporter
MPSTVSTAGRSTLILLLFAVAIISYVDRGSLSIAAPLLARDFGLSPTQLGVLLSSFFWIYALLQISAGWLVDRGSAKFVLAGGVALWSMATLSSGLAQGIGSLIAARLVLGAGEAVMFPCFAKLCATAFAPADRGLPNAILDAGTKIGPALGVLVGGLLIAAHGWRILFFVLGGCSLLWLVPWLIWGADLRTPAWAQSNGAAPSLAELLRTRDVWGTLLGAGSYTYAYFFLLTWLPTYLVRERHLSLQQMAVLGSVPYWAAAVAAILAGWGSDALIRRGHSATVVRKSVIVTGLLLSVVALPSAFVADISLSIWLLSLAYVAGGIFASNLWAVSQTLAGPAAAGKWAGLQNCFGAITGILAPVITGLIVQGTGSFRLAFAVPAALAVGGAASYLFLVGPIREIDWSARLVRLAAD